MGNAAHTATGAGGGGFGRRSTLRRIVLGVVVLVMACVVTAMVFLDAIAARLVASEATATLGTTTSVRSVHLGLVSGTSTLHGLRVDQPEGFTGDPMLQVERIEVQAGLQELLSSTVVVDLVAIHGVAVDLSEVNGRINLQVVADSVLHAQSASPPATAASAAAPAQASASVTVRELRITGIRVKARLENSLAAGKILEATIPDIEVKDIGTQTTADEVAARISAKLMDRLIGAIAAAQIEGLPASFSSGLSNAGQVLGDALQNGGESIGDGLKKVGEAFEGIFGGPK